MTKKRICIIGCGTYGSYLLKRLLDLYGNAVDVTVIEIGNEKIKSEEEIGIKSESAFSNVARHGRYFGLGGTSARWGGQILFFDERDNVENESPWNEIVNINNQYYHTVVENVLGGRYQNLFEQNKGRVKVGIWLKYKKRNLYKQISKPQRDNVTVLKDLRVTDFVLADNKKITSVVCKSAQGETKTIEADFFYLTTGAIESCRLLLKLNDKSGLFNNTDLGKNFGDHLSVELYKIHDSKPMIEGVDFLPRLYQGSLITKRIIVYAKDGRVGYIHPIFNKDVKAFSTLKTMLFGKQKVKINLKEIFQGVEFLTRFAFSVLVQKKMYAHRNNWSLQLDIEQIFPNENTLQLTDDVDRYDEKVVRIDWNVSAADQDSIIDIRDNVVKLLEESGLKFTPIYNPQITTNKIEDIYHPSGFMRLGNDERAVVDFNSKVQGLDNLYHFSTAMFPSAKSINPTAAAFCFIENHLQYLKNLL